MDTPVAAAQESAPIGHSPARLVQTARAMLSRAFAAALETRAPPTGSATGRAVLVGAATVAYFVAFARYPRLTVDDMTASVQARDCLERSFCPSRGPESSFVGIFHGALWIRTLTLLHGLGLGADGPYLFMVLLAGAAVGLAYAWVWRHWSPALALQTAGWYLLVILESTTLPRPEPQDLMPLPALALVACLVRLAGTGEVRWAAASGAALYFLAEGHAAGALTIPLVLAASVAFCRWPLGGVTLAAGVALAGACACSGDALALNLVRVRHDWLWLVAAGGLAAALGLGLVARRTIAVATTAVRVRWAMTALAAWAVLVQAALRAYGRRGGGLDYIPCVSLPLGLALATGASLLCQSLAREGSRLRRVVSHLVAAAPGLILAAILAVRLLWMATFPSPRVPLYSVHDSQQLSRAFGELGLSYADALRYLRGPYSFDLASAGVLWSPWDAPVRHGLDDLRVLKVPEAAVDAIAPGWKAVRLGEGSVGILGPIHSWLRQDEMRYCAGRPGDDVRSATCRPFSDAVWRRLEGANTFIERMDDLQQAMSIWWPAPTPPSHTFRQEWLEIPIEITGDDAFRELELVDSASGNATRWPRWWVESIDGVGADTSPDGQRVKIWSGSRRKGSIRWTRNLIENGPPWQAGPGYVELRPGEEGLARWLQTISPVTRLLCGFGIPWQCP